MFRFREQPGHKRVLLKGAGQHETQLPHIPELSLPNVELSSHWTTSRCYLGLCTPDVFEHREEVLQEFGRVLRHGEMPDTHHFAIRRPLNCIVSFATLL